MRDLCFYEMLGMNTAATMNMMDLFACSSNVITTDNPEYTVDMFNSLFPIFNVSATARTSCNQVPISVFNLFKAMADKAIKKDRYFSHWEYFMGLFIAHHLTLYLQTQSGDPGAANALKKAVPTGVATSKSVDGLSISYDLLGVNEDLSGYGSWKLTAYGQQLVTLTKIYGGAGMWVNR